MEENYMATTRNGHELKDMYNPETNTLDIRSNGLYPSNVLSNLCSNGFRLDGMVCSSMEGFLQSLKRKELDKQRQICSMKGGTCNGVLSLGKTYGYERLESAAALMKAEAGKAAYRLLANILRNNRDKAAVNTIISTTPQNDNVRGASAYRGIVSSKDRQEP